MLVATHGMCLVGELFPRTLVFDDGQVSAHGPTIELLGTPHLLRARPGIV
jgi:energy-coupling factor transporter ATP-binding protein EcfA2